MSIELSVPGVCICAVVAVVLSASTVTHALDVPHYTGGVLGNASVAHDGGLRWAVGVNAYQVVRSCPSDPARSDGTAFTIRHHPFIAYWGSRFWVYHLGSTLVESDKGGRVQWSEDGVTWDMSASREAFGDVTHQRCAFYVAANGRFLVTAWYGGGENARGEEGSRLVREIRAPDDFGAIHVIKNNASGPAPGINHPAFTASSDAGFVEACQELYDNKLYRQQWQEEDQDHSYYVVSDVSGEVWWKAFAWYTRDNGQIVSFWKGPRMTVAESWEFGQVPDPVSENVTWSDRFYGSYDQFALHGGSKIWGQRTADGAFAVVGNCPGELHKRWPLAVTTSSDGWTYAQAYLSVAGDFGPQRYPNATFDNKDAGLQYVRGITEGNGTPPGDAMWLTYSHNKEDIWVAMVPTPVTGAVSGDVSDDFQDAVPGSPVPNWNVRSAQWADVRVVEEGANRFLRMRDRDRHEYAKAFRIFETSGKASLSFKLRPHQNGHGRLEIDVLDAAGRRPVRIAFDETGSIRANSGADMIPVGSYAAGSWIELAMTVDASTSTYRLSANGSTLVSDVSLAEAVSSVERLEFRTGAYRLQDWERRGFEWGDWATDTLPDADVQDPESVYDIDDVVVSKDAPPFPGLIASIDYVSTSQVYELGTGAVAARPYIDRDYRIESLPSELADADMVRTSNNDDMVTTADHLRFTLSRNAEVYLAFKSDATALPAWASEFALQAGTIVAGGAGTFRLYKTSFAAGQVTLGGNDRGASGASSCYFVMAVELVADDESDDSSQADAIDTDSDGLPDLEELAWGTDPANADTDGDGLTDGDEVTMYSTNPVEADSDSDGMSDATELAQGFAPLNADQDSNGIPDGLDDWDADGVDNQTELANGESPGQFIVSGSSGDAAMSCAASGPRVSAAAELTSLCAAVLACVTRWKFHVGGLPAILLRRA